jgi:hypothetical protein
MISSMNLREELPRGNSTTQWATFLGLIVAGVASRLLWHPENLTAVGAAALFGGMFFRRWHIALAIPLLTLLASDLVLSVAWAGGDVSNWNFMSLPHYVLFGLTALAGLAMQHRPSQWRMIGFTLATTVVYFFVSNLTEWFSPHSGIRLYPLTAAGLVECYVAGLPFARNQLIGNLLYGVLLLGAWQLAARRFAADGARSVPATATT